MTRVILIIDMDNEAVWVGDDPRPGRELVMLINTGQWAAARGRLPPELLARGQWATYHPGVDTVTVMLQPPPVHLPLRQYQVLYGLVEGKTPARIAYELGITTRTVYLHIAGLKERFQVGSRSELVVAALELRMVDWF